MRSPAVSTTSPAASWRPRRVSTSPLTVDRTRLEQGPCGAAGVDQVGELEQLAEADAAVADRHLAHEGTC